MGSGLLSPRPLGCRVLVPVTDPTVMPGMVELRLELLALLTELELLALTAKEEAGEYRREASTIRLSYVGTPLPLLHE